VVQSQSTLGDLACQRLHKQSCASGVVKQRELKVDCTPVCNVIFILSIARLRPTKVEHHLDIVLVEDLLAGDVW